MWVAGRVHDGDVEGVERTVPWNTCVRQIRAVVFREARAGLRQDGIRIVDDLTRVDWQEKRRVQPLMNKLYTENKRPFFRNGRLYAENRPVPFGLIDDFMASEEGRAAMK